MHVHANSVGSRFSGCNSPHLQRDLLRLPVNGKRGVSRPVGNELAGRVGIPLGDAGRHVGRPARPADEGTHLPERPSWTCSDDGHAWPCVIYKRRLWSDFQGQADAMREHMISWMDEAGAHLSSFSDSQLRIRFVDWTSEWPEGTTDRGTARRNNEPGE
jgi:hypothetical protein